MRRIRPGGSGLHESRRRSLALSRESANRQYTTIGSDFKHLGSQSADCQDSCDAQFCAPPNPFIASVMPLGVSRICEKRTTVTVSSIDTGRA